MRPTDRAHLDADYIALTEEAAPSTLPVRRTGQFLHSTADHVLDRLSLIPPVQDASRMIYFHNASGIWSGNSEVLRLSLALRATERSCCCSEHTLEKAPPPRVHAVILTLRMKVRNTAYYLDCHGRDPLKLNNAGKPASQRRKSRNSTGSVANCQS